MRNRLTLLALTATLAFSGCQTNAAGERTFPLLPIIGLLGMAVDGDDKDDYESLVNDCDCDGKCHCH